MRGAPALKEIFLKRAKSISVFLTSLVTSKYYVKYLSSDTDEVKGNNN